MRTLNRLVLTWLTLVALLQPAIASIQALPEELACSAPFVITGKLLTEPESTEQCVRGPCPASGNAYPTGLALIRIDKILSDQGVGNSIVAPDKVVRLKISYATQDRSTTVALMDQARRQSTVAGSNQPVAPTGLEGKSFVFLLYVRPEDLENINQETKVDETANKAYEAIIWADGEQDERMRYAVNRRLQSTTLNSNYQICMDRYIDPCNGEVVKIGPEEIYSSLISKGVSGFSIQCSTNHLANIGESAVPVLIKLLGSEDSDVRKVAENALAKIGPRSGAALPSLMRILRTASPGSDSERSRVCEAIGSLGYAAKPALQELLDVSYTDNTDSDIYETLVALAKYFPKMIVPRFIAALNDPVTEREASEFLRKIGTPARQAFPHLIARIKYDESTGSTINLGEMVSAAAAVEDTEISVPALTEMLGQPLAARFAAESLGTLGFPASYAIPPLLRGMNDSKNSIDNRVAFASALTRLGVESSLIDDFLLKAIHEHGNQNAMQALSEINSLPPKYFADIDSALTSFPGNRELCQSLKNTHVNEGNSSCQDWPGALPVTPKLDPQSCKEPKWGTNDEAKIVNYCSCRPQYPRNSFLAGEDGVIRIKYEVGTNNELMSARVIQSSGYKTLDKTTSEGMKKCRFSAATQNGKRVQASFEQQYTWKLSDESRPIQISLDADYMPH